MELKILFVEDVRSDAELMCYEIVKSGINLNKHIVDNQVDYVASLSNYKPDLVISDFNMPSFDGMTALFIRNEIASELPFIMVTGSVYEDIALQCLKAGADDYLLKQNLSRLGQAVIKALEKKDLARRKKYAEEALMEKESYLRQMNAVSTSYMIHRSIFELMPDGILVCDLQGKVKYVSRKIHDMFRIPPDLDLTGTTILERVSPDYRDLVIKRISEILNEVSNPELREFKLLRYDGSVFWADISSSIIRGENENELLVTCRDITARKNIAVELLAAKEKAEESDKLKTAFLNNISHEIRTPLNAILGFSELMSDPGNTRETMLEYTGVIMQSSNRLLSIVNDIIDISNIEAGIVKISKCKTEINSVLRDLHGEFSLRAKEKNLEFLISSTVDDGKTALFDVSRVKQILSNLLSNAFKFTDKGSVVLSCSLNSKLLSFQVSDTGIGIDKSFHEKIFGRFYQVNNSASRPYEGTGLGLSIAKALALQMNGELTVTSEASRGSVFELSLKMDRVPDNETGHSSKESNRETEKKTRKRLLIADDESTNILLLKLYLEPLDLDFVDAGTGAEAIEICKREENIDLVLMDLKMPGVDGFYATREIKKIRPSLPVIAVTAFAFPADREKALECGCSDYISKPVRKDVLLTSVRQFVEKEGRNITL